MRALQVFKAVIPTPLYKLSAPKPLPQMTMTVKKETAQIRPFVVCAILRNVTFDKDRYDSFIELQDAGPQPRTLLGLSWKASGL